MAVVLSEALNQRHTCSQLRSKTSQGTGLYPTKDFAVREMTELACLLKALKRGFSPVLSESTSELADWSNLIGLPRSHLKMISSKYRCKKLYTVNMLLSVVPEIGILNLLPSSSKKSRKVVNDSGELNLKMASTLTFSLVTPMFSPSGYLMVIGS